MLTQEQKTTIEKIRKRDVTFGIERHQLREDIASLLKILDSLPKKQPRQYTEEELLDAFEDNENRDRFHEPNA